MTTTYALIVFGVLVALHQLGNYRNRRAIEASVAVIAKSNAEKIASAKELVASNDAVLAALQRNGALMAEFIRVSGPRARVMYISPGGSA